MRSFCMNLQQLLQLPVQARSRNQRVWLTVLFGALLLGGLGACVYRVDVQQGNLLDEVDIEAVQVGMTRSQVRFLLGTPIATDPYRKDRWDYMYYLRPGKGTKATQRWVIVWFDGDTVREISPDVPIDKPS